MKSFSTKNLKDKKRMTQYRQKANKRYVNGKLVGPTGESFNVQNAASLLKEKKNFPTNTSNTFDAATALAVMHALGCTVTKGSQAVKNKSFLDNEEQYTSLKNKNIEPSKRLKNLKNTKQSADKMFRNLNNPFYKVDEKPSDEYIYSSIPTSTNLNEASASPANCVNVVSHVFSMNIINRSTLTIKEFK